MSGEIRMVSVHIDLAKPSQIEHYLTGPLGGPQVAVLSLYSKSGDKLSMTLTPEALASLHESISELHGNFSSNQGVQLKLQIGER